MGILVYIRSRHGRGTRADAGSRAVPVPRKTRRSLAKGSGTVRTLIKVWAGVLLGTLLTGCSKVPTGASAVARDLLPLAEAASRSDVARNLNPEVVARLGRGLRRTDPLWPLYTFLAAETRHMRGETVLARAAWRDLAEWAAADRYKDGSGGSALGAVAFWRWLQAIDVRGGAAAPDEVRRALATADKLRTAWLCQKLFADSFFSSLPQVEEDTLHRLALLAWSAGQRKDALRLFMDYLSVERSAELGPVESEMQRQLATDGLVSADRLTLFQGKRLAALRMTAQALPLLEAARKSTDAQVSAEAGLYLVRQKRIAGSTRRERADMLAEVIRMASDPDVVQEALHDRAILLDREGKGRDVRASIDDLLEMVKRYPDGKLTDSALLELAARASETGDQEQALAYYSQLRDLPEPNRFLDSAHYQPALLLFGKGDLQESRRLLEKLETRRPEGPLHPANLFWLGRIAEQEARQNAASLFQKAIEAAPYGYYAIRARMHLRLGARAAQRDDPDESTLADLRTGYSKNVPSFELRGETPYHARLRAALTSGVYANSLGAGGRIGELYPGRRLEEVPLPELDASGVLARVSVFLALRQDAMAAAAAPVEPGNILSIAAALGQTGGDWTAAIRLTSGRAEFSELQGKLQHDSHYLATAYPRVFTESIRRQATARKVSPDLIYSVIRHESAFSPVALSTSGALGLFQFTPRTFESLNTRWDCLKKSGAATRETYLMNPEFSMELGTREFAEELLPRYRWNPWQAAMDHNVGEPSVRAWVARWKSSGRPDDVEYFMDTIRASETRLLVRDVFVGVAIAKAVHMFDEQATAGRTP